MSGNLTNPVLSLEVDDSGLTPGARAAADALNKLGDAAVTVETRLGKVSATASSLVNSNNAATKAANSLAAAQDKLATSTVTLDRALAAGDITQTEYAGTITGLQAKVQKASDAVAAASAGHTQLAAAVQRSSLSLGQILPQFEQFFSGIATGQPLFTSFIQQGHQLADQMEVSGTSVGQLASTIGGSLKSALSAVLSPIGLAVAGAAALGTGLYIITSAAESAQSRLGTLQQGLSAYGQSAATVISVSNDLAKSTDLSRAALDDLGKTLVTGVQGFQTTAAQLKNLESLTRDFAAATGQSLSSAAGQVKGSFTDPYKLALSQMQAGMVGFTGALVANVAELQAQGKTGEATAAVLAAITAATAHAADPVTGLDKAIAHLSQSFNTAGAGGTTFLEKIGSPFLTKLNEAIEQVAKLATALNNVEGGAVHASGVIASLFNPAPGSTIRAVGSAVATATFGAPSASGGTRSDRNNNPGNLKFANQAGATGQDAAGFAIFPDYATGLQALQSQLTTYQDKYGINTISGIVNRYAPASDNNDMPAYINALAGRLGTTGSQTLDLHDPGTLQALSIGIAQHEGTTRALPTATPSAALPSGGPSSADQGAAAVAAQITAGDGYTASLTKQNTAIQNLLAYQQQLIDSNKQNSTEYRIVTEDIEAARQKYQATLPALSAFEKPINDNIALLNAQAAAWSGGAEAAAKAAIQQQSFTDAQKITATTSANYLTVQQSIADTLTAQAQAQAHIAEQQQLSQGNVQLAYLNTEVSTLGQDYDQRQKILAALKEKQALEQSGKIYSDADKQALIDQAVNIAGVTSQLQLMQSSLQEVGNFGVQVFDQVGSAITNAFISGQGAAVNFGSIIKSVAGIALQELGKLAIGNVLSNTLGGTNLPTIGSVFSALGGGSPTAAPTTASTGQSALGLLSNGQTILSGANTLSGGSLFNSLGLTGPNGLTGIVSNYLGLGSGSSGGVLSGAYNAVTGFLNTGTGIGADAASSQAIEALGINAGGGLGGASIGALAGGAGLGFGAGSLAGSFEQSALNKTGPAPTIGAGTGAIAGAIIGSYVPVIGTAIGGLLGGLIGGAGGGLIGPHPASEFSSIGLSTTPGGLLTTGTPLVQGDSNAAQEAQAAAAQSSALNNLLIQSGISISSLGGIREIGTNDRPLTPTEALSKTADINSAFPDFRFNVNDTSTDEGKALASQVNGQSFGSLAQLQSVFTEVDTFVNQTLPSLTAQQTNVGSLAATLSSLSATFQPAIDEGNKLGVGVDALTAAYAKQTQAANDAVATQVASDQTGFQASYLAAAAQVSGNPADAQTAALYAFDNVTATQQRQQLVTEYQGIFGDAYASTTQFVQTSAALEQTLGEQRLAIQTQYNTQITSSASQAVNSTLTSLQAYVQKLQGASTSPLSPQAQYTQAKSQFQAVSGAAAAGDGNSINSLSTYADALLSASRAVNGSGAAYASDYSSVLSSVSQVVNLGPDALTQAFMAAQMQSQTAQIIASQGTLASLLQSILTAVSQQSGAPARIAA